MSFLYSLAAPEASVWKISIMSSLVSETSWVDLWPFSGTYNSLLLEPEWRALSR